MRSLVALKASGRMLAAALSTALVVALVAGCGGGSKGSSVVLQPNTPTPGHPSTPQATSVQVVESLGTDFRASTSRQVTTRPVEGSVIHSLQGQFYAPTLESDSNGQLRIRMDGRDGHTWRISTATDTLAGPADYGSVPTGYRLKGFTVGSVQERYIADVYGAWANSGDDTLTGGYYAHLAPSGRLDIGAFFDGGTRFDSPPSASVAGRYRGPAAGGYTASLNGGLLTAPGLRGSWQVGAWQGTVDLTATGSDVSGSWSVDRVKALVTFASGGTANVGGQWQPPVNPIRVEVAPTSQSGGFLSAAGNLRFNGRTIGVFGGKFSEDAQLIGGTLAGLYQGTDIAKFVGAYVAERQ